MSHYPDLYEAEALQQQEQKTHLFYSNKVSGITMVADMIKQELEMPILNETKIEHMLAQVKCLAERG